MMQSRTTLASEVVYRTRSGVRRERNVQVEVLQSNRNRTVIAAHLLDNDDVTLVLSEAERIALIEALGGKDR